jgi:methanogenic corrinoid protein MtbC1
MIDYLRWLASVLAARSIPTEHLAQSLEWLEEFFAGNMEAADAVVVVGALRASRVQFLEAQSTPLAPLKAPEPWPQAGAFEATLLAGRQRDALTIVSNCMDSGHDLVAIERHVIQPALYSIGEKWQANQVSVAQEHLATAIALSVMSTALLHSPAATVIDKRVLLACVDGNNHAVGLRMVADAFQLGGWDVQYLGASVPTPALVQQVKEWKPAILCLSVSFAHQLPVVRAVIAQLREHLGNARPAVMVGGLAINRFDQLARLVGADGFGVDAQAAVASAHRIVSPAGDS